MNEAGFQWFKPRSGGRHIIIFILGFLFFPVMGLITILTSETPAKRLAGVLIIVFGILVIIYILVRSSAKGFRYGLGSDLMLKQGSRIRHIDFSDIAGAAIMDGPELDSFMRILAAPLAESKIQMDLSRWWENSRVYGDITLWVSVAITESETQSGGPQGIIDYTLNIEGPVVMLKLITGELLMLTPENTEEFISKIIKKGAERIEAEACISAIPSPNRNSYRQVNRKSGRKLRIMSIVTALIIIAAVLGLYFTIGPGNPKTADAESGAEQLIQ